VSVDDAVASISAAGLSWAAGQAAEHHLVHHTDDGRLRLSVELDADEGARLLAALDLARFYVSAETPRRLRRGGGLRQAPRSP
jgi:hypothetical protein